MNIEDKLVSLKNNLDEANNFEDLIIYILINSLIDIVLSLLV